MYSTPERVLCWIGYRYKRASEYRRQRMGNYYRGNGRWKNGRDDIIIVILFRAESDEADGNIIMSLPWRVARKVKCYRIDACPRIM